MKNKGFTVIEMLVVLSMIGAIALIIMPQLIKAKFKADRVKCLANERALAHALEIRLNSTGIYPDILQDLITENLLEIEIPVCPSNGQSYSGHYEVSDEKDRYTISCPGIHYEFLNMREGYPQYSSKDGLNLGEN
ncbi:MAG: type II secretion system GspH family protein [Candidatus Eremiobacteraeota bacterium]|nr:type II secretion system GspH family protein [Candidatus Eremiobacteraeota bacterium]